jgi:hypothetical protein
MTGLGAWGCKNAAQTLIHIRTRIFEEAILQVLKQNVCIGTYNIVVQLPFLKAPLQNGMYRIGGG